MTQTPSAHRLRARSASIQSLVVLALLTILHWPAAPARADLWAAATFHDMVLRIDENTGAILPGGVTYQSANLMFPAGVAIGPDGNIYVSSQGTGEILFYDGDTGLPLPSPHENGRDGLFATLPHPNPGDPDPLDNPAPSQIVFSPDGNYFYVSDFNNTTVRKINASTGLDEGAAMEDLAVPAGLAFMPDGDLLVGDMGAATIYRIDNGIPAPFIYPTGPPQAGDLQTPANMLIGPDDEIYVVDLYGNQILKYDENGQNKEVFAEIPPEVTFPLPPGSTVPSNSPSDIAIIDGEVIVSLLGISYPPDDRGALLRYDMEGNLLEFITDVPGIYDGDHLVTIADFDKWKEDYGLEVQPGTGADGNGDGKISAADFTVWRDNLGANAGLPPIGGFAYAPPMIGSGAATTVPEPSTLVIMICAVTVLLFRQVRL